MSLIDEFLEENLMKDLNHQLLSQIQQQNTAVQSLVSNLEQIRNKQNIVAISNKINRIESFLQLKKQILTTLQPINSNASDIFDWILNTFVDNSFLYELMKRQQFFVNKELIQIGKQTLLQEGYIQQYHQDTQFANKIIRQLRILNQEKSQSIKSTSRQKIKQIDYGLQLFEQKIIKFQQNIANFNNQMLLFIKKVYGFDQKIRNDFYQHFKSDSYQNQSKVNQNNQQQGDTPSARKSQKSHISLSSKNQQSRTKFPISQQYHDIQRTPRTKLQTQVYEQIQRAKNQKNSFIQNRYSTIQQKKSNYNSRGSLIQNKKSIYDNKRSSIDFKRPSDKYQEMYQQEIRNMGKTLSTFNYNRPQSNHMLYTTNNFGQNIRLPTKWATNSRSSISYYPLR